MNKIQMKEEVRRAIYQQWDAFAREHPHLAEVIDQELLVEQSQQSLQDDPEFRTAMRQAETVGTGFEILGSVIDRIIREFLRRL
jgi:hypothetical protein